jgi:hypothetical protein
MITSALACNGLAAELGDPTNKGPLILVWPIVNLIPYWASISTFVYYAALLGLFYFLWAFWLPPIKGFNSRDSQTIDFALALWPAAVMYYVFSLALISFLERPGCSALEQQAIEYFTLSPDDVPPTLQSTVEQINQFEQQT